MGTINEDILVEFADRHLAPYQIKDKLGGREIVPALCPICQGGRSGDKHTFALSIDKLVYVCKRGNCDAHGRVEELFKLFGENTTTIRRDMKVSNLTMRQQQRFALPKTEMLPVTQQIYDYFALRKISKETVDAFRIAADPKGMIVFPFYEDGVNVFVKFRRPYKPSEDEAKKAKEWREPNTKAVLFHMDDCVFDEPLYITEGEIDAMSLYQAGITNVVSVPSGCDDTSWIENCFDWLEKFEIIVLFGDNDAPGRKMVNDVAKRLDESRCMIVEEYPDRPLGSPCKDANEILYFYGAEKLKEMVDEATEVTMEGLVDLSTIPLFNPRVTKMIPSSFYSINYELGGYSPGDLVVWTGRTGAGKSTVVTQEVLASVESGENICYYTAEFSPTKLKRSLYLQAAGSEFVGLEYDPRRDREIQTISPEVCSRIDDWLAGRIMLCTDNVATMKFSSEYLVELLKYARKRNGCTVAVVDNIMTAVMGADDDQYFRAQEKFTLELKKIASSLGMVVHLVCHPRKTKDRLSNDDVSGSASITRLADTVISVSHGTISVLKNRNEGTTDTEAKFVYYPDCRICADVDHNVPLHCSWDRTNIEHPKRLASEVYRPIYPDLGGYPI